MSAPVTREDVFALAYACVAAPRGGPGLEYCTALIAYRDQLGLTNEEMFALNDEAASYARSEVDRREAALVR